MIPVRTSFLHVSFASLFVSGILVAASVPAASQTGNACAFDGEALDRDPRQVTFDAGTTGFQFASDATTGTGTLRGTFDLRTARLVLQSESPEAEHVRFVLEYASVVEFRDLDGDARFGLSDEVVTEVMLAEAPGATLQSIPRIQAGSHEVLARYPLNVSGPLSGVAEIRFVILSEASTIAGEERAPGRLLVTTAVDSFPFARNDTRLALKVRQQGTPSLSTAPGEILSESEEGALSYRWSRCVDREGTTLPVGPLVLEYPSGAVPRTSTIFAFPYGDRIEHVSSVGLAPSMVEVEGFDVTTLLPKGDALVFGLAATTATCAIALSAWRRIRGA